MHRNTLFLLILISIIQNAAFSAARKIEDEFNSKIFVKNLTNLGGDYRGIHSIRWSADGTKLLVDKLTKERFYSIQILDWEKLLDEKKDAATPFSESRNENLIQAWNNSTPAWTKDTKYIIFSGQKEFGRNLSRSGPFFGMDCSLWIGRTHGRKFWKFTPNYPGEQKILGATAPDISPDGRLLFWTVTVNSPSASRYYGERKLAMVPIYLQDGQNPRLSKQVHLLHIPGADDFVESYGFSPDGSRIFFAANLKTPDGKSRKWFNMDLYSWDIKTKDSKPVPLTQSNTWDRHPSISPAGKKITWSSGMGFLQPSIGMQGSYWYKYLRSELWIMDADGHNKKQLTQFNNRNAPEFMGRRCYIGTSAWHPDGQKIAVVVNTEGANFNPDSHLFILELEAGIRTPGGRVVPLKALREREKKNKFRPSAVR